MLRLPRPLRRRVFPPTSPRYPWPGQPDTTSVRGKRGIDMMDCVLPRRLGEHRAAWNTAGAELRERGGGPPPPRGGGATATGPEAPRLDCAVPGLPGLFRAYLHHVVRERNEYDRGHAA